MRRLKVYQGGWSGAQPQSWVNNVCVLPLETPFGGGVEHHLELRAPRPRPHDNDTAYDRVYTYLRVMQILALHMEGGALQWSTVAVLGRTVHLRTGGGIGDKWGSL